MTDIAFIHDGRRWLRAEHIESIEDLGFKNITALDLANATEPMATCTVTMKSRMEYVAEGTAEEFLKRLSDLYNRDVSVDL